MSKFLNLNFHGAAHMLFLFSTDKSQLCKFDNNKYNYETKLN